MTAGRDREVVLAHLRGAHSEEEIWAGLELLDRGELSDLEEATTTELERIHRALHFAAEAVGVPAHVEER